MRHILADRYRVPRAWHDTNDARLREFGYHADVETTHQRLGDKADHIWAIRKGLELSHDDFVVSLNADLTHDQVEIVKDKMTYGKLDVTCSAYAAIFPALQDFQKQRLRSILTLAREEAMDGGSSEEKSAIFKLYKNRCKAYLTEQGYDVDQAYRDWGAARKRSAATTRAGGA